MTFEIRAIRGSSGFGLQNKYANWHFLIWQRAKKLSWVQEKPSADYQGVVGFATYGACSKLPPLRSEGDDVRCHRALSAWNAISVAELV
jgi:hypothetical protein